MARTLSDVPVSTGGGYYKPGFATVRFESVEERPKTGNKLTDGILIRAVFIDGSYNGKKAAIFRQLSEKAEYRTTNILFAAGLTNAPIPDAGDYSAASWAHSLRQVVGLTAPVEILTEPNQSYETDENQPRFRNEYRFSPPRNGASNGSHASGHANGAVAASATSSYDDAYDEPEEELEEIPY